MSAPKSYAHFFHEINMYGEVANKTITEMPAPRRGRTRQARLENDDDIKLATAMQPTIKANTKNLLRIDAKNVLSESSINELKSPEEPASANSCSHGKRA
jgi:hypothetical protein